MCVVLQFMPIPNLIREKLEKIGVQVQDGKGGKMNYLINSSKG